MPWLLSKVTGKLCEQLTEGYFLGPNLWIDQTSISSHMEWGGERRQREKGGKKKTEEKRNSSKEMFSLNQCYQEKKVEDFKHGNCLYSPGTSDHARMVGSCCSLGNGTAGRSWGFSKCRRSTLQSVPPARFWELLISSVFLKCQPHKKTFKVQVHLHYGHMKRNKTIYRVNVPGHSPIQVF